MLIYCGKT